MDRHKGERYNSDPFQYKHSRGPPSPRTFSDGSGNPQHHHGRSPDVYHAPRHQRAFNSPTRHPTDITAATGGGVDSGRLHSGYQMPPPPRPLSGPLSGQKRGYPSPEQVEEASFAKLFVGSVPRTATEEDIRPLFEEQGRVLEVAFIKDKRTGQQQGCCFIKYGTSAEADRAIRALHNQDEKLCVFLIEKALSRLPAGKQDILGIFDLRGFGTENADLKFLTFLFDVFYNYYPRRLGQVLFVDAPFVFKPLWQLVKPMLKQYASLVRFCSAKEVREEYFTEDTLPASFRK